MGNFQEYGNCHRKFRSMVLSSQSFSGKEIKEVVTKCVETEKESLIELSQIHDFYNKYVVSSRPLSDGTTYSISNHVSEDGGLELRCYRRGFVSEKEEEETCG